MFSLWCDVPDLPDNRQANRSANYLRKSAKITPYVVPEGLWQWPCSILCWWFWGNYWNILKLLHSHFALQDAEPGNGETVQAIASLFYGRGRRIKKIHERHPEPGPDGSRGPPELDPHRFPHPYAPQWAAWVWSGWCWVLCDGYWLLVISSTIRSPNWPRPSEYVQC